VENRLLRTALRRMAVVPRLPDGLSARLHRLDRRLDGVRPLPPGGPVPSWRPNRLNQRYVPALRLAGLVLRHQSVEPGPGGLDMAAFVVDMAKVFEDFVGTALREALVPYPGETRCQYPGHLDVDQRVPIRADVVHLVDGRAVAIFDAKYKTERVGTGIGRPEDMYQVLAYCTAFGARRGYLLYASGDVQVRDRVANTGVEIHHYPLDLAQPPEQLLGRVAALAATAMAEGDDPCS
jgi:5-methylcytosine-specific restriction enzyme subunit McrC